MSLVRKNRDNLFLFFLLQMYASVCLIGRVSSVCYAELHLTSDDIYVTHPALMDPNSKAFKLLLQRRLCSGVSGCTCDKKTERVDCTCAINGHREIIQVKDNFLTKKINFKF